MISRGDLIVQNVVIGALAVILVGGSVACVLMRIPIPEWMVGFDGVIVTAAFGASGFFAVARTAAPTATALADLMDKYHQLAITVPVPFVGSPPAGSTVTMTTPGEEKSGDRAVP